MKKTIITILFIFCTGLFLTADFNIFELSENIEVQSINNINLLRPCKIYKNKKIKNYKDKTLKDGKNISGKLTVYFPKEEAQYPLILISHGWISSKKVFLNMGRYISAQGYVVAIFTSKKMTRPKHWLKSFESALDVMLNKNLEEGPLLHNKIDTSKIGIMAHSMGGAGALAFANSHPMIKALVGIHPYNGASKFIENIGTKNEYLGDSFKDIQAATLILTGEKDITAYPEKTYKFFKNLNEDVPACFLSFQDFNHNDSLDMCRNLFSGGYSEKTFVLYSNLAKIWFDAFLKDKTDNLLYVKKDSKEFKKIAPLLYMNARREHESYPNYDSRNLP